MASIDDFDQYEKEVRMAAAARFEKNCHPGGEKVQRSVEWAWFVSARNECEIPCELTNTAHEEEFY